MERLKGKRTLVTGGPSGIGAAIPVDFYAFGFVGEYIKPKSISKVECSCELNIYI